MGKINVYQGNSKQASITVEGLDSLDGYTAKLYIEDQDGTEQFEVTGTISGLDITYETTAVQNQLTAGKRYKFESYIYHTNGKLHTLDEGTWFIKSTPKDHT